MDAKPLTIGVAGGTGSGKTTVVEKLMEAGNSRAVLLPHDAYYREMAHLSLEERGRINWDHPDALETDLLVMHLRSLIAWEPVAIPQYDFRTYSRLPDPLPVQPCPVVIVEGILILAERELRDLLDIKIFVDTDADIRFIRRLTRDVVERGRSLPSVIEQYLATVRPMHNEFVEPSKRYADLIIPEGGHNFRAIEMLVSRVREAVASSGRHS
jgi:uridine kinase